MIRLSAISEILALMNWYLIKEANEINKIVIEMVVIRNKNIIVDFASAMPATQSGLSESQQSIWVIIAKNDWIKSLIIVLLIGFGYLDDFFMYVLTEYSFCGSIFWDTAVKAPLILRYKQLFTILLILY